MNQIGNMVPSLARESLPKSIGLMKILCQRRIDISSKCRNLKLKKLKGEKREVFIANLKIHQRTSLKNKTIGKAR